MAISEIEKIEIVKLIFLYPNLINRVENIKDKLKNKDKPHIIKDGRRLNKSYLGFVIISIFFISGYFFYQKPEFFIGKNTIYEEELLVIKDYIDFFITNLIQVIKTQLMK